MDLESSQYTYESFKYIYPPDHDHQSYEVMESRYKSHEDLGDKFTVCNIGKEYRVYPSIASFMSHLEQMDPANRTFHEVIFNIKQKLKIDIDATVDKITKFQFLQHASSNDSVDDLADSTDPIHNTHLITHEEIDSDIMALLADIETEHITRIDELNLPESVATKYNLILDTILQAIRDTFFITYGKEADIILCGSIDPTEVKYSSHIILDGYCVTSCEQAQEFTKRLCSYLPSEYHTFLDLGVNKRVQNFRLVNCHKLGESYRVKKIVESNIVKLPLNTLITYVTDCQLLPNIVDVVEPQTQHERLHPNDFRSVLELTKQDVSFAAHRYKFCKDGMFIFTRLKSSECEFCNKSHDTDNTLIVTTCVVGGVVGVFKQCRKYIETYGRNGSHFAKIGEFEATGGCVGGAAENIIGGWTDRMISKAINCNKTNRTNQRPTLFAENTKYTYCEPTLRPFELTKTLVVHAAMKMGKTKALTNYMETYFPTGLVEPIIRFISFRQTFSGNIKEKFTDFTLYSDVKGALNQPKLIIQVESLHRLDIGIEPPDLLILDECESIFEQFDSGLLRGNFNKCFATFQYLIKYSKHVVCMDAAISDRTFRILRQMRPGFTENTIYHYNTYKNATNDKYFIGGDKFKWLGLLYSSIEADEKIAVPMSSITEAKILEKNLIRKYPSKMIKCYSSDSNITEKKTHFSDVNTYWKVYDILIYTPTVSAGVSFEEKHFDKVFGYFTDQSCPVETCIQMIGRIRDVRTNLHYICISATGNNLPTEIDALRNALYARRENLIKGFDETGLVTEYGPRGEIIYHTGDYFQLWLENNRMKHLSKNMFIGRMVDAVSTWGATAEHLTNEIFEQDTGLSADCDELTEIQINHTQARAEIRGDVCKAVSNAKDLTEEEAEDIRSLIANQKDIPSDTRYAFEKYRLRSDYNYHGTIDEKFVDKYKDPKVRRMFKNITRISGHETTESAWKQIQSEESANHKTLMELDAITDLNRKYVFDQHRYALGLLRLAGWKNINDPSYVHKVLLKENIHSKENIYWENIRPACTEFGVKTPIMQQAIQRRSNDLQYINYMLIAINKILTIMYGIVISVRKKDPDMYFLAHNSLFTMDPSISRAKGIPLIIPNKKTVNLNVETTITNNPVADPIVGFSDEIGVNC